MQIAMSIARQGSLGGVSRNERKSGSMNGLAFVLIVGTLGFGFAAILEQPRSQPSVQATFPNPHRHAKGEDVLKEVAPEIKIVESSMPQRAELKNLVLNKSKRFSSFTVTTEEGLERIFVVHVLIPNRREKVSEIEGVAWPNRPLSDPVWAGDYFIFDRSSNPNAVIHYVFDMQKRELVAARAFTE
jgi:hypothetical protein